MVGGSGMYADSLMFGLDSFPKISPEIRDQIELFYKSHGLKGLQELLLKKDPKYYTRVDIKNPTRLIRAIEVCIASEKPYSSFLGKEKKPRNFVSKMVILHRPRKDLYERINHRVDQMIEVGLIKEAQKLLPNKDLSPLKTVGYKELFPCFEGKEAIQDGTSKIKKNTRRYAKRQITWFKKYNNALSFPADTEAKVIYELLTT